MHADGSSSARAGLERLLEEHSYRLLVGAHLVPRHVRPQLAHELEIVLFLLGRDIVAFGLRNFSG